MIARSIGRSVGRSIGAGGFAVAGGGPSYDTDAQTYITAVEAADGQSLETGVKDAINAFVVGCKSDGIWTAIKASCILAGARTLDGALQPLVGTAPTNNNFVSGDYSRTTGLVGDGATKYLDSNRNNDADPQNDKHVAVYSSATSGSGVLLGTPGGETGRTAVFRASDISQFTFRVNSSTSGVGGSNTSLGFVGISRSQSSNFSARSAQQNATFSATSQVPSSSDLLVFIDAPGSAFASDDRLAFYSIGESLDLALLDSRVSTLMTAIGAAIP